MCNRGVDMRRAVVRLFVAFQGIVVEIWLLFLFFFWVTLGRLEDYGMIPASDLKRKKEKIVVGSE